MIVQTPSRPSWEQWAIGIATAVAMRADCTRRRVGAVVLDADRRVLSVGYNGAPPEAPGCLTAAGCPRGSMTHADLAPDSAYTGPGVAHPCVAIHAEENAIMYSDPVRRRGGWMAITDAPCPGCQRLLKGSGLAAAFWFNSSVEATHGGQVAPMLNVLHLGG